MLTLSFRGYVEPCRQQPKLRRGELPALNAVEQMLKRRGRKILSADFRHGRRNENRQQSWQSVKKMADGRGGFR